MTDAQKFGLYLPWWNRAAKRLSWKMAKGRLQAELDSQCEEFRGWPDPAGPAALQVVTFARQAALQDSRGVTADDLRRSCTVVATGRLSSKHLNNSQVNRLVTLLKLLVEPDDLDAVGDWLNPENAELRGLVKFVSKQAPEGLLRSIFSNAYGTVNWEDGSRQQIVWLLKQVKGRQRMWRQPVEKRQLVEEPF
jgi:hypothetical protein